MSFLIDPPWLYANGRAYAALAPERAQGRTAAAAGVAGSWDAVAAKRNPKKRSRLVAEHMRRRGDPVLGGDLEVDARERQLPAVGIAVVEPLADQGGVSQLRPPERRDG